MNNQVVSSQTRPVRSTALVRVAALAVSALSPREREIIQLLAEGLSNKAVAERIALPYPTVHMHVENIFAKLGVNSRAAAITQWALATGQAIIPASELDNPSNG